MKQLHFFLIPFIGFLNNGCDKNTTGSISGNRSPGVDNWSIPIERIFDGGPAKMVFRR